ncbi:unnamed protein product [Caenorhabditis nigoni]
MFYFYDNRYYVILRVEDPGRKRSESTIGAVQQQNTHRPPTETIQNTNSLGTRNSLQNGKMVLRLTRP